MRSIARNLWFPTRSGTHQAVQPQRMARGFQFRIYKVEGMHYVCSEAIAQLICAFIFTCAKTGFLMMQPILNLMKALGRPEIISIMCTQILSFNFRKSATCDCHCREIAYMVATKMFRKQKKTQFLNTLASLCN